MRGIPARYRNAARGLLLLLGFIAVAFFFSFFNERNSCLRSADVREQSNVRGRIISKLASDGGVIYTDPTVKDQVGKLNAKIDRLPELDCGFPLPDTPKDRRE